MRLSGDLDLRDYTFSIYINKSLVWIKIWLQIKNVSVVKFNHLKTKVSSMRTEISCTTKGYKLAYLILIFSMNIRTVKVWPIYPLVFTTFKPGVAETLRQGISSHIATLLKGQVLLRSLTVYYAIRKKWYSI